MPQTHRAATGATRVYTTLTWVRGPLMLLLLGLTLAAPFLARGAARRAALLFAVTAYVLLIVPVATQVYDARYAISALGPLCVATALAIDGWMLRRAKPQPDEPVPAEAEELPAAV